MTLSPQICRKLGCELAWQVKRLSTCVTKLAVEYAATVSGNALAHFESRVEHIDL